MPLNAYQIPGYTPPAYNPPKVGITTPTGTPWDVLSNLGVNIEKQRAANYQVKYQQLDQAAKQKAYEAKQLKDLNDKAKVLQAFGTKQGFQLPPGVDWHDLAAGGVSVKDLRTQDGYKPVGITTTDKGHVLVMTNDKGQTITKVIGGLTAKQAGTGTGAKQQKTVPPIVNKQSIATASSFLGADPVYQSLMKNADPNAMSVLNTHLAAEASAIQRQAANNGVAMPEDQAISQAWDQIKTNPNIITPGTQGQPFQIMHPSTWFGGGAEPAQLNAMGLYQPSTTPTPTTTTPTPSGASEIVPVTVTTQAQYDALPPGTPYIDSNGTRAIKR